MQIDEQGKNNAGIGEDVASRFGDDMELPSADAAPEDDFGQEVTGEDDEEKRPSHAASMLFLQQGAVFGTAGIPGLPPGGQPMPVEGGSAAGWLVTFADMMTLLMCFFVLLFSFSQVDVVKFRDVARSMAAALGGAPLVVLGEVAAEDIVAEGKHDARQQQMSAYYAELLRRELREEVEKNVLAIDASAGIIAIRILQNGSFDPGSAELQPQFLPTAQKIRDALVDIPGALTVAGHTDDTPIATTRFRSNWELSGARAFSVMHALLQGGVLPDKRFVLMGFADTKPLQANGSEAQRALNRRVEIIIDQRDLGGEENPVAAEILDQELAGEVGAGRLQLEHR